MDHLDKIDNDLLEGGLLNIPLEFIEKSGSELFKDFSIPEYDVNFEYFYNNNYSKIIQRLRKDGFEVRKISLIQRFFDKIRKIFIVPII